MDVPTEITCVECGGTAGLLSAPPPDDVFHPGDVVAYVCADCGHRFDIVLDEVEPPDEF
jgi:C4-type Zn-finger protein